MIIIVLILILIVQIRIIKNLGRLDNLYTKMTTAYVVLNPKNDDKQ